MVRGEGLPIAVEAELTAKAPYRLQHIVRSWRRARCVSEVRYYAAPGTPWRAVERVLLGELGHPGAARGLQKVAVRAVDAVAHAAS